MPKQASTQSSASQNHNTPNLAPPTLSRPFRSRKNRPCDACRRAKTRCAIPEIGPPCVECQQTRKQCTFDELPPERKKPAKQHHHHHQNTTPPTPLSPDEYHELPNSRPTSLSFGGVGPSTQRTPPQPPKSYRTPEDFQVGRLDALVVAASEERQLRIRSEPPSIDLNTDDTLEPHVITSLVTDDLLPIGSKRTGPESAPQPLSTPYIRQVSYDATKPQYVIFNRRPDKKPPSASEEQLRFVQSSLAILQPSPEPAHLVSLFFEYFNVAFPIVLPSSFEGQGLEPAVRARICLLGLCHSRDYRGYSGAMLKLFASRPFSNNGPGRLASITLSLLELSYRPTLDVENNYLTLAKAIAQAQLLGLHIDPSNWAIPTWEKDYRRILWWALRTFDAWMSFLNSRPSHIQGSNQNVPIPSVSSLCTVSNEATKFPHSPSSQSFVFLCKLSMLVGRLQSQVFTIEASTKIPRETRVGRVVTLEGEMAALLNESTPFVREARASSGVPSLMVCLLGFRCMLRRIQIELYIGLGSPFTPDADTLDIFAEAVDFFCSLEEADFNGYWLSYVGHILSSMTSSLIRLSLATTASIQNQNRGNPQAVQMQIQIQASSPTNPLILLSRLRTALDRAHRDFHWELAEAALSRAEKVAVCLIEGAGSSSQQSRQQPALSSGSNEEYLENVIAALEGRYHPGSAVDDHLDRRGSTPGGPLTVLNGHSHPSQLPPLVMPLHPPPGPSSSSASGIDVSRYGLPTPHHHPQSGGYIHHQQEAAMSIDFTALGMGWQGHGISPNEWDFRSPIQAPPAPNGTSMFHP